MQNNLSYNYIKFNVSKNSRRSKTILVNYTGVCNFLVNIGKNILRHITFKFQIIMKFTVKINLIIHSWVIIRWIKNHHQKTGLYNLIWTEELNSLFGEKSSCLERVLRLHYSLKSDDIKNDVLVNLVNKLNVEWTVVNQLNAKKFS